MRENKTTYVYALLCEGTRCYVGSTYRPEKRFREHELYSNVLPRPLQMQILDVCPTRTYAVKAEQALIRAYRLPRTCRRRAVAEEESR